MHWFTLDNLYRFIPDVYRATQNLAEMVVSFTLGNALVYTR